MGYFLCDLRHFFGFDITFLNVKVNQKSYNFLVLATAVRLLPFLLFLNSTDEGRCFLALLPQEVEGTKGGPQRGCGRGGARPLSSCWARLACTVPGACIRATPSSSASPCPRGRVSGAPSWDLGHSGLRAPPALSVCLTFNGTWEPT